MSTILCGVKKEDVPPAKVPLPKMQRQPLQSVDLNIISSSTASFQTSPMNAVICNQNNTSPTASYSNRISLSSVGSVTSSSSSDLSPFVEVANQIPQMQDSFDVIDSVFSDASGLETSLARAVSASINIEVNDLSSDNEDIEDMTGSLPPMQSFLGL